MLSNLIESCVPAKQIFEKINGGGISDVLNLHPKDASDSHKEKQRGRQEIHTWHCTHGVLLFAKLPNGCELPHTASDSEAIVHYINKLCKSHL